MLAAPVSTAVAPASPAPGTPPAGPGSPEDSPGASGFARLLEQQAGRTAADARPAPGPRGSARSDALRTAREADSRGPAAPHAAPPEAGALAAAAAEDAVLPASGPADDEPAAIEPGVWTSPLPWLAPRAAPPEPTRAGADGPGTAIARARAPATALAASAEPVPAAAPGPEAAAPTRAEAVFVLPQAEPARPAAAAPETPLPPAAAAPAPEPTPPAPAVAEAALAARPGSSEFASELGTRLATFVRDGIEHARLELHPVELGPVTVQIQLDGANARVHLAAEQGATRQALEQALPTLAGTLREAGLTLAGGGVFEQPQQPARDGAPALAPAHARSHDDGEGEAPGLRATAAPTAWRPRGVVDLVA